MKINIQIMDVKMAYCMKTEDDAGKPLYGLAIPRKDENKKSMLIKWAKSIIKTQSFDLLKDIV